MKDGYIVYSIWDKRKDTTFDKVVNNVYKTNECKVILFVFVITLG